MTPRDILVFDLDNTLYPASSRLFDQVDERMSYFVQNLLGLSFDAARALQKDYFYTYGTTLVGLMRNHGIAHQDFLDYVHTLDLSVLPVDLQLIAALEAHPGRKVVFTNGSEKHARNILQHLCIAPYFDGIFDIVAAGFCPKPHLATYEAMLEQLDIDPTRAIMFEDIPRNLEPAARLGMTTVWIHTETEYARMESEHGTPLDAYVHYRTPDLAGWLHEHLPLLSAASPVSPHTAPCAAAG
jgi:putative hydrolase of the HAD superfamily